MKRLLTLSIFLLFVNFLSFSMEERRFFCVGCPHAQGMMFTKKDLEDHREKIHGLLKQNESFAVSTETIAKKQQQELAPNKSKESDENNVILNPNWFNLLTVISAEKKQGQAKTYYFKCNECKKAYRFKANFDKHFKYTPHKEQPSYTMVRMTCVPDSRLNKKLKRNKNSKKSKKEVSSDEEYLP